MERRLGRQQPRPRRLPVRGGREQPNARREAQPRPGARRHGDRGAVPRVERARVGRPASGRGRLRGSIENSVAISGDTLYFANSGGLVQGWDMSGLRTGTGPPRRVFRFWTGEDTDASVVVDEQGMLYVGSEWEKRRPRAADVGQMMKLDPHRAENPLVWSKQDQGAD